MADPQTERSTKQICEQLLARVDEQAGMTGRMRAYLLEQNGDYPGLAEAAAHVCVSPRTPRRELQNAGTTYRRILDQVRQSIAVEYLTTTQMPVSQIAVALGYKDLSNFGRAFKRWTGKAPSELKR